MRIVHISDLHFWHITLDPRRLMGKRLLGMANLIVNRARKYRRETMPRLIERIIELGPDHVLVTGDLTTTSLEEEFEAARSSLQPLIQQNIPLSVLPGNHDRYTRRSARVGLFEQYFAEFAPSRQYPWLKRLGSETAVLALDPCHPNPISAIGTMADSQLKEARELLTTASPRIERLLVASHYPVRLPEGMRGGRGHRLRGRESFYHFLQQHGPNIFCHGHVHNTWALTPPSARGLLILDPGAALKKRPRSGVDCSLLEILLNGWDVTVSKHLLRNGRWEVDRMVESPDFFRSRNQATPLESR